MTATREIPVTQFLMPDGREREGGFRRPEPVAVRAFEVLDSGLRFEAEVLPSGEIHMTVADPTEGVDLYSKIVPNGPGVPLAFDRLVEIAWVHLDPAVRVLTVEAPTMSDREEAP